MGRNHLQERDGDHINAVLAVAGNNFSLLLRSLERPFAYPHLCATRRPGLAPARM
jgi:hypothetical protein